MIPQPGNVHIHVMTISKAIFQFTRFIPLLAPTPNIENVFTCVVETGTPNKVEIKIPIALVKSVAKPSYASSFTIPIPTFLIILYPPIDVPRPITNAVIIANHHKEESLDKAIELDGSFALKASSIAKE